MDSDELEDRNEFDDIRCDLNLDDETTEDAWNTFRKTQSNYTLEGEKMDWIACSVYTACRNRTTQTMGKVSKIEGNMVSLTRILRCCNISLVRFFNKMKNWSDMASLPDEMRNKLNQLERNFNVTTVIFKKFKPIFEDIFKCPVQMPCRFLPKPRKAIRKQALNSLDVFTFCWTLFVYIKSKYSQISDDLVNSYHLLLVCLDYCFYNVLSFDNYMDIINTNFYESLQQQLNVDPRSHNNDNRISIIDVLCAKWNGIPIEVKQIKKHWFKPFLKTLIEKEEIRKRANGIIDSDVIDFNFKYLKREYEQFVLTIGDFDECVFLNETASEELGTSEFRSNDGELDDSLLIRLHPAISRIDDAHPNNLIPMTPLSSRQYLATRTPVNKGIPLTPISCATNSISRLHSILIGQSNEPSVDLTSLFAQCKSNPKERIQGMVQKMGDIFLEAYSKVGASQSVIHNSDDYQYIVTDQFPKSRLNLAVTFFYNVLEKILKGEMARNRRPDSDLSLVLARVIDGDMFQRSLFACSLEIVLHSYSPANRLFPWILDIFNEHESFKIHPFYFYKVIEPILRDEQNLSREIVKHMNTIEEHALEHLVWSANSPVWTLLKQSNWRAPRYTDVALSSTSSFNSPAPKANFGNAIDYGSIKNCSAKRQLSFTGDDTTTQEVHVLSNGTGPVHSFSGGTVQSVVTIKREVDENVDKNSLMKSPMKSEINGQLKLFFRKVYSLSVLRLRDLASKLEIKEELYQMIWTCLENALSEHTHLMCDHHLDQIIMCSIFCICKLNNNVPFADIIKEYRRQPQAKNYVYRNVVLDTSKPLSNELKTEHSASNEARQPLTPSIENGADKKTGSVIDFYNKVFIKVLSDEYILQFSPRQRISPTLSPMPRNNKIASSITQSPIRRVSNYPIFISPLRTTGCPPSPNRKTYRFQDGMSASNDLKAINSMMRSGLPTSRNLNGTLAMFNNANNGVKRASKRLLDDLESDNSQSGKTPCLSRKINDIMADRHQLSASSSANASCAEDSNDSLHFNGHPGLGINISGLSRVSPILGNSHESSGAATASSNHTYKPQTSPRLLVIEPIDARQVASQVNFVNGNLIAAGSLNPPMNVLNQVVAE